MKTRNVAMMLSVALAASAARAVNYTWNSSSGGDLLDQTNYTPEGLPTASDTVTYNIDANYRLTASGDVPSHGPQTFSKGEIELDLGGHVWDAGSKNFTVNNPRLTLYAGSLSGVDRLTIDNVASEPNAGFAITGATTLVTSSSGIVGGSYPYSAMTVSNAAKYTANTLFVMGNTTASYSNAVYVLSSSSMEVPSFEVKTYGNTLIISNNSQFTSGSAVNFAKGALCGSNRVEVLADSTLRCGSSSGGFSLGAGAYNTMIVDASTVEVLVKDFQLGTSATGTGNLLEVRNGSILKVGALLYCGTGSSSDNEMYLTGSGTKVEVASLICSGHPGTGNRIHIGDHADVSVHGAYVGAAISSPSNAIMVTDGALLDVNGGEFRIGTASGYSTFTVDGASVTNMATVKMGANGNSKVGTSDNLLEIVNGGKLYSNSFVYFGGVGNSNNVIRVSGPGSLLMTESNGISWSSGSTNTVMYVEDGARVASATTISIGAVSGAGDNMIVSNATVSSVNTIQVLGDSEFNVIGSDACVTLSNVAEFVLDAPAILRFVSDQSGFGTISKPRNFRANAGARLIIDGSAVAKAGGGTFELMTAESQNKGYGSDPLDDNVTLIPEDSELIVTKDNRNNIVNVSVRVPSKRPGIVVIVR